MDKFDRIYALHNLLANRRHPVPITGIMDELECSKATVTRLIGEMRLYLDAPLEYDRARKGYFYNHQSEHPWELPGLWFNTSELHALLTAQTLLERVDPGVYSTQLAPLKKRIEQILEKTGNDGSDYARRIRILAIANRTIDNRIFRYIASAVIQRRRVDITYHGRHNAKSGDRIVSPQRLVHYRDNWYLDAWCHASSDYRTFALERIERVRPLKQPAKKLSERELDAYYTGAFGIFSGRATDTAVLRFTPERARWVAEEQWHPKQEHCWLDDGRYELKIPYGSPTELIMDILKYGADVEVAAPASLRNAVRRRVRDMARMYE